MLIRIYIKLGILESLLFERVLENKRGQKAPSLFNVVISKWNSLLLINE